MSDLKHLAEELYLDGLAGYPLNSVVGKATIEKTVTALEALVERRELEARREENVSIKSIFEEAATWAPKCYNHEKPSSYCHICKKRKWFAELSKEVIPIIDERLEQLRASKETS